MKPCDVCGGTKLLLLGYLGKMGWLKCRDCGSVMIRKGG